MKTRVALPVLATLVAFAVVPTVASGPLAVSSRGLLPQAGGVRTYQLWYRNNSASYCTPTRFNMSNGVEIAWRP